MSAWEDNQTVDIIEAVEELMRNIGLYLAAMDIAHQPTERE